MCELEALSEATAHELKSIHSYCIGFHVLFVYANRTTFCISSSSSSVYILPPSLSLCQLPPPPTFFCLPNSNCSPLFPPIPSLCPLPLSVYLFFFLSTPLPLPVSSLSSFISFCSVTRFLKPLEKLSRPRYVHPYTCVTGAHISIYEPLNHNNCFTHMWDYNTHVAVSLLTPFVPKLQFGKS